MIGICIEKERERERERIEGERKHAATTFIFSEIPTSYLIKDIN